VDAAQPFFPEGRPLEGLIITLDPGHGGSAHQPGYSGSARGVNSGVVEGDLNMLVAGHLRHHLVNAGAKVYMTRWDDRKVTPGDSQRAEELGARTRVAVEGRSHLFPFAASQLGAAPLGRWRDDPHLADRLRRKRSAARTRICGNPSRGNRKTHPPQRAIRSLGQ
jgi:hypothetical protein